MRALLDPHDRAGKGGKPYYGEDNVDDCVDIGIGKSAYPLKHRESCLVNEGRYAAPTLQRR